MSMSMNEQATLEEDKPTLQLVGLDGNAFAILGRARRAARDAGWLKNGKWERYHAEATSGDYDNLLAVTMQWFNTDPIDEEELQ
jgi:hypothetical protein